MIRLLADMAGIFATPEAAQRRLAARGFGERHLLGFLLILCLLAFLIRLPSVLAVARIDVPAEMQVASFFVASMILAPLFLYFLAAVGRILLQSLGRKIAWLDARLLLFSTLLVFQFASAALTFGLAPIVGQGVSTLLSFGVLIWFGAAIWKGAAAYASPNPGNTHG